MSRLPDRTGILILPFCMFFSGAILAALMISALRDRTASGEVMLQMIFALAHTIGSVGTVIAAAVLTVPTGIWFVLRYRYYRTRVLEDRRRAGLP